VSSSPSAGAGTPALAAGLRRRAFKPVYLLYYRVLFGRRFPGAEALARRVQAWELATGRGDAPAPAERWEAQYRGGHWELMRGLDELSRYGTIAAYLRRLHAGGRVLDVGCGEGILREHLGPGPYTGIDVSAVAVERARAAADDRAEFHAADAEEWSPADPGTRFDAIVFNECVYYFTRPVDTVRRYRQWLAPGGTVVVSTFRSRRADGVRRRLVAELPPFEQVEIAHPRKGRWVVSLHR
jgi:SAM-dependent methyltransferase